MVISFKILNKKNGSIISNDAPVFLCLIMSNKTYLFLCLLSLFFLLASYLHAHFSRNYRTSYSLNASSPRLSSLHESYIGAYVQTAVLVAAEDSQRESRSVQQLAVSYAAHDALTRIFYAQYQRIDSYLREIEDAVKPSASQSNTGRRIGEAAAAKVVKARADDGFATVRSFRYGMDVK